jgi:topoisomerase-4 subunit A
MAIKGRSSKGNLVSKYPIKKIEIKERNIDFTTRESLV